MIGHIRIRERGPTPRGMARMMNAHKKEAWSDTGRHFHVHMRDRRFTPKHALDARYGKRKGQNLAPGTSRANRTYFWKKKRSDFGGGRGHAFPLVFSGESRRNARIASITSTSKGARVRYPGLRKFNLRHPKSRINMAAEFRGVLPRETDKLAEVFDEGLDRRLNSDNTTDTYQLN